MNFPKVFYLKKHNNLPHYEAGKELHTIEYQRGWVEYLQETSKIYYTPGLTQEQYQSFLPCALNFIKNFYNSKDYKILSLLKHLATERMDHPFSLPLFSDQRQGNIFTCGSTRFTAEVLCGTEPKKIPVVFQTDKNKYINVAGTQEIISTDQIELLANLDSCEFRLTFSQTQFPHVISSILRNTIHEGDPGRDSFKEDGICIFNFWDKFTKDNRIHLSISCDDETQKLIHFDPTMWEVTFSKLDHNGFSFDQILGKFGTKGTDELNLYVYNISQPFHLEYLLPWTSTNSVWYHTLNKKVHLFDTTRGPATACWPIIAMGNFVK